MTRHTPNRPDNNNSVMTRLRVQQEEPAGYRLLRYWVSVMVGLLSVGLLLQRYRGAMPVPAAPLLSPVLMLSEDSRQPSYDSHAGITPLLLSSAVAYQTGHSALGMLSSVAFWLARPVSAQAPDINIVVPEFRVNGNVTGSQGGPTVTSLGTDEWVVVWFGTQTGNFDIYAQRYAGNGSVLGSEFRVNSNITGTQGSPAVTSLGTGEWVVVWFGYQTGDYDIYAQRYAGNGSLLGSEFRVNSNVIGTQWHTVVTNLGSDEWVVVWVGYQTGNADIYAQRYAGNGSVLGSEFRVNSNVTGDQEYPAVTSLGSGEWVVVWDGEQTGDADIYAQRYAGNGSVLGSEFRVNSDVTNNQYGPEVTSLGTDEWVVVWTGTQTGDYDIYAQRYAGNGSVLGPEFRVNSVTTGNQEWPKVSSLSNGEWVVVWDGEQTGDADIYAQRYAGNGSVLGSEFRVNSNVTGDQQFPTVTSLGSGEWVVVWQGNQTGDLNIYGSIFSSVEPLSTTVSPIPSSSPATTTLSSAVTTRVSSTSPTSQPTTTNDNSAITSDITPNMPPLVTVANANSGTSGVVIGMAAGAGGFAVAACLGVLGFYACRKKSRPQQANHSATSEVGTSLKPAEHAVSQRPSAYVQMNVKPSNQSDNNLPVSHSRYGRIDEMKRVEKEYDKAPSF